MKRVHGTKSGHQFVEFIMQDADVGIDFMDFILDLIVDQALLFFHVCVESLIGCVRCALAFLLKLFQFGVILGVIEQPI